MDLLQGLRPFYSTSSIQVNPFSRKFPPAVLPLLHLLHALRDLHPPSTPRPAPHTILFLSLCLPGALSLLRSHVTSSRLSLHRATFTSIPDSPRRSLACIAEVGGCAAAGYHLLDHFRNKNDHVRERRVV